MKNPKDVIHESWYPVVMSMLNSDEKLQQLNKEILTNISFQPSAENIFNVFSMPVNQVKVVILGQDPYPTPGDAIGYSFATISKRKMPAILKIIKAEIINELVDSEYSNQEEWKTLKHWRDSGVFLLNTALTVETANAGSHLKYWLSFTRKVIMFLSKQNPCIWMLWGKKAQSFNSLITRPFHVRGYDDESINQLPINNDYNYILSAPHPAAELYSDGNTGFYGCNHFKFVNKILSMQNKEEIAW